MQCVLEDIWEHEGYSDGLRKRWSWKSPESCILAQNLTPKKEKMGLAFRLKDFMLVIWQVQ